MNELLKTMPRSATIESFEPYCVKVAIQIIDNYQGCADTKDIVDKAKSVLLRYFDEVLNPQPYIPPAAMGYHPLKTPWNDPTILPKKEGG